MAYSICEPCVGTKDTACVDVCPVDCIPEAFFESKDDLFKKYEALQTEKKEKE